MTDGVLPRQVAVNIRHSSGRVDEDLPWADVSISELCNAAPWRTFRWYYGQKHYSGTYWSATMQDHVMYESRLELARLLLADIDPAVSCIVSQPFLLTAVVEGRVRKHIPDYLLVTGSGPVVVDVKPLRRLAKPAVVFTFAWTRIAVEARGWQYEVCHEQPEVRLENVRFLAGYRRSWLFDPGLLDELRTCDLDGLTIAEAAGALRGYPEASVRAAILHLLWAGYLHVDLDQPLGGAPIALAAAR
jgi:hypothetical protein